VRLSDDSRGLGLGWIEHWRRQRQAPATVVGVMDRDSWTARTDNIVVIEPRRRRLSWIPRDLWSDVVADRINGAFCSGGHPLFLAAVRELGFSVEFSVVLLRSAVERALDGLRVTVPVARPMRFWYPLAPTLRLEDGAKLVAFDPPEEALAGERIHQWIGARRSADGPLRLPDLDRIKRQQVLVGRLLQQGFDLSKALADPALVAMSSPTALQPLAQGGSLHGWSFRTHPRVEPATIDGKKVLVRRRRPWLPRWAARGRR
jgi:anionic cell wall polymer biosynthesis LytR-Cps2A-Psr (LCP) family protein